MASSDRTAAWAFSDGGVWTFPRTRILGILNVTRDSFSDGGRYFEPEAAVARAMEMVKEGADAIDVGGESSRPGSMPVPADEEIRRVVPVIGGLRRRLDLLAADPDPAAMSAPDHQHSRKIHDLGRGCASLGGLRSPLALGRALRARWGAGRPAHEGRRAFGLDARADKPEPIPSLASHAPRRGTSHSLGHVLLGGDRAHDPGSPVQAGKWRRERVRISVDTSKASVAAAAIEAGAEIVNDVTGFTGDPAMAPLVAMTGTAAVLMHMRGTPLTMQEFPHYDDLMGEIGEELRASLATARSAGIADDRIVVDPGIGFGKTAGHNLEILARLSRLKALGRPLLVGVSRKSFLGKVTGLAVDRRLEAGLAAAAAAVLNGASILRVHDVAPTVSMVRVIDAINEARGRDPDDGPECDGGRACEAGGA